MGLQKFANNAAGTTTTALLIGGTGFTLQSGEGAEFPSLTGDEYCYVRIGTDGLNEVVKVTARTTDTLTCEATTMAWSAGTPVVLTVSAELLGDLAQNNGDGDTLDGHRLTNYTEGRDTPAPSAAALTVDYSAGPVIVSTLDENVATLSFTNLPATGQAARLLLVLVQDGTGGRSFVWPGSITWMEGDAPAVADGAGDVTMVNLLTIDGGTTWYGARVGTPAETTLETLTRLFTSNSISSSGNAVAWNSDDGYHFHGTLNENTTVAASSGTPYDGQKVQFAFTQGGTGGTVAWNAQFVAGSDFSDTIPEAGTTAADIDVYLFQYFAGISKYVLMSHLRH